MCWYTFLILISLNFRPSVWRRVYFASVAMKLIQFFHLSSGENLLIYQKKICLIKNLKMSLRNHRQIRLDKYVNSNRCMERLAELVLFLDWFLVNPKFLDGVRLSAPLFRSSISYLFVRLPLKFTETHFYPGMEIEKSLKKITERFTPLLNTIRLIRDPTRQQLRKPFYCAKNSDGTIK